ncbi:MAG: hypothetical protein K6C97_00665 [Treponema sp.]|nr:hypothetical protein [Treponema sp.]
MEPLTIASLGTGVEILKNLKDLCFVPSNQEQDKKVQELLLRNYYSEIFYNKKILETINFNKINNDSLKSINEIAPLLKNDYGKAMVASLGTVQETIEAIQEQSEKIDESKLDKSLNEKTTSLVHKIIFTVNRIEVLKNLSNISTSDYLKTIRASIRFRNIKKGTDEIYSTFKKSFDNIMKNIYI